MRAYVIIYQYCLFPKISRITVCTFAFCLEVCVKHKNGAAVTKVLIIYLLSKHQCHMHTLTSYTTIRVLNYTISYQCTQ